MTIEIDAAERHRQQTDDLRGAVERFADIVVDVLFPKIETACQRKLTMREADASDGALQALRQALDNLETHRLTRAARSA